MIMTFKITDRAVFIGDIQNKSLETKLKAFDADGDDILSGKELCAFYDAQPDLEDRFELSDEAKCTAAIKDIYALAGGHQHRGRAEGLKVYEVSDFDALNLNGNVPSSDGTLNSANGAFSINGHSGMVFTQWKHSVSEVTGEDNVQSLFVSANFDGFEQDYFKDIESATLIMGPKGMGKEKDSMVAEKVGVQMKPANDDHRRRFVAAVNLKDANALRGDANSLSFYIRLEHKKKRDEEKPVVDYVNLDYVADGTQLGPNFQIDRDQMNGYRGWADY
jgi:hypothetical protein